MDNLCVEHLPLGLGVRVLGMPAGRQVIAVGLFLPPAGYYFILHSSAKAVVLEVGKVTDAALSFYDPNRVRVSEVNEIVCNACYLNPDGSGWCAAGQYDFPFPVAGSSNDRVQRFEVTE